MLEELILLLLATPSFIKLHAVSSVVSGYQPVTELNRSLYVEQTMVFAFFCQSVNSTPCRLLYTAVFGDDMQVAVSEVHVHACLLSDSMCIDVFLLTITQNIPVDQLRETRKDQLMQVRVNE